MDSQRGPEEQPKSTPARNFYMIKLEQSPVLTKAITSALIAGLGDVTSQVIIQVGKPAGQKHFSWRSTAAFATFSMVVTGPITHYLYQFLESTFPEKSHRSSLKKVFFDRLLFAPPYLLALFYFVAIMEGKSHSEAWRKVKTIFWPALLKNILVWGMAQYINMSYIPVKYRVLFANLVSLIWNIYLAMIKR